MDVIATDFGGIFFCSLPSIPDEAKKVATGLTYSIRWENPRFSDPQDPVRAPAYGKREPESVPVHILHDDPWIDRVKAMVPWVNVHGAPELAEPAPEVEKVPVKRGPGRPRKKKAATATS